MNKLCPLSATAVAAGWGQGGAERRAQWRKKKQRGRIPIVSIVLVVGADDEAKVGGDEAEDKEILPTNSTDPLVVDSSSASVSTWSNAEQHKPHCRTWTIRRPRRTANSHDLAKIKKLKNRLLPFAFADSAEKMRRVFLAFWRHLNNCILRKMVLGCSTTAGRSGHLRSREIS